MGLPEGWISDSAGSILSFVVEALLVIILAVVALSIAALALWLV
jgi:hypothetical protein